MNFFSGWVNEAGHGWRVWWMEVVEAPQRFSGSLQPGHDLFLHCFPGEETDKDRTIMDLRIGRGEREKEDERVALLEGKRCLPESPM